MSNLLIQGKNLFPIDKNDSRRDFDKNFGIKL